MKLIFKYNWCVPYEASGTEIFIIECDSKIKLQVYVLDKIKEIRQRKINYLLLFNFEFYDLDELEYQIEYNVYITSRCLGTICLRTNYGVKKK